MTRLLAANPGLKSRFPTTIGFDDYAADELMAIADGMMRDEALELDADARAALMGVFKRMAAVHDRENGNGRAVRNLLERAKREQALRLMGVPGRKTKEEARPRGRERGSRWAAARTRRPHPPPDASAAAARLTAAALRSSRCSRAPTSRSSSMRWRPRRRRGRRRVPAACSARPAAPPHQRGRRPWRRARRRREAARGRSATCSSVRVGYGAENYGVAQARFL